MSWIGIEAESAFYTTDIIKGSDADRAGLKLGDIVLSIDDKPVPSQDWQEAEYRFFKGKEGEAVNLIVASVREHKKTRKIAVRISGSVTPRLETYETPLQFAVTAIGQQSLQALTSLREEFRSGVSLQLNAEIPGLSSDTIVYRINGKAFRGVKGFEKLFEAELASNKPISLDVVGVDGSNLFFGQTATLLVTGLDKKRIIDFCHF